VKPIVQMLSPEPKSAAGRLTIVDWGNGLASAATKSGLIAAILATLEAVDTSRLTPWQAFGVSFAVLCLATMARLKATGPADDDAPTPTPDGPAPDPDASISTRKAA